jgi:hypothetical protein
MCGAVWIDVGQFPQTLRRVARRDQAAFEAFQRFLFRVQGVGVTDIGVHTRGRAAGSCSARSVRWIDTDPRSAKP